MRNEIWLPGGIRKNLPHDSYHVIIQVTCFTYRGKKNLICGYCVLIYISISTLQVEAQGMSRLHVRERHLQVTCNITAGNFDRF